ncbi:MAG: phosphonate ABC transporter, permease protein PhnE [Hyphomicrobiaceae bacterium]
MSIALSASEIADIERRFPDIVRVSLLKRSVPWLVSLAIVGYLVFCVWFFSLGELFGGGRWERIGTLLREWVSYTSRPEVTYEGNTLSVTYNRYDPIGHKPRPAWLAKDGPHSVTIFFGSDDEKVVALSDRITVTYHGEDISFDRFAEGWRLQGTAPSWVRLQKGGARINYGFAGEIELDKNRIAVWRRFFGWANWLFDLDSKLWGKSAAELWRLVTIGERLDPRYSNLSLAFRDFWYNANWQHGDVLIKLLQTIVMAFVGTLFAALLALPLAFVSARTILANGIVNGLGKRFFEFMRTVDMFVWALFFTRGFGPGPLAGISAIFFTDTGTLGKTYTEALENIDDKQREGMRSVGASAVQVQRFGVLPQVMPVLASQALYQWESNTRSATIIGAMGAGGIGLKLLESMRTNSNWPNVCYMVVLILIVVYVFDGISTRLRHRLIGTA